VSLKKGSKGGAVKSLQTALKITADGDFGPITEKAVKAYQTKKGLPVTGIADETTWKRLGL
jgi:peptidoglycan hydrolase-like protein with peptidoglycan-binding domain